MAIFPSAQVCEPWPVDLGCCEAAAVATTEMRERAVLWASNELWRASFRRYGVCTTAPTVIVPRWCWCHGFDDPCSRRHAHDLDALDLGPAPVYEVTAVVENGVILTTPAAWHVHDWRWLVRNTGRWSENGVTVTWKPGVPPDISGLEAAAELACEWLIDKQGGKCRIKSKPTADEFYGIPLVDRWILHARAESDASRMWDADLMQPMYRVTQ